VAPPVEQHQGRIDRAFSRSVLERASDERLVALTREGSDAAFEAIVRRYRTPLVRYGTTFLDPQRAEDAVQQSFLKALTALRRDKRPMQLKPWLYRIVHNEALNAARRTELGTEELDEQFDGVPQPPDVVARSERLRELVSGIAALPERQRSAVLLREFEGRSYAEIAGALGVTTPVVRALLHRARVRLRDACGAFLPIAEIRSWLEALSASAAGSSAAKVGAAAVVTGVIAGGAAVGVPSNHSSHQSAVAGSRPTEQAAPVSRPQVVKLQQAPRVAAPKAPAPQTASRPQSSDHTQRGAVHEPATTVRPASSGDGRQGDEHSGGHEKRPAGSHKKDNSGPSGGDQGEHVAVTGGEHVGPGDGGSGGSGSGDGSDGHGDSTPQQGSQGPGGGDPSSGGSGSETP
jgi:RNA polymerase sigma factor (sigma-70 family)